ncbi:MAG: Maf family nucleotide pyrophosphatase [Prolixibacteraceae bacterium]
MNWFPQYNYILASKSPRRQQLLQSLGIGFEVITKEVNERFPPGMHKYDIPVFLAELKSHSLIGLLKKNDLLITADTIVWLEDEVLGKPADEKEANTMLQQLSGKKHEVISGVCLTSPKKKQTFYSTSSVEFKNLTKAEIDYYIKNFKPFDKAGSYGIQEWIGTIGIKHIEGSFYNVMGLPIQKLYEEILKF